jgi:Transposase, Mutator family
MVHICNISPAHRPPPSLRNLPHNLNRPSAPNLAELEVAKRNQASKREPPCQTIHRFRRTTSSRLTTSGSRAISTGETLNALLDAEADRLCNAQRYERSEARRDTRAGHYKRGLQTKAGEVRLKVPKPRQQTFETAIIERYRRRESSVEEALIEMYLAGVSVRRAEDITEALWGTRVSPSTVLPESASCCSTISPTASIGRSMSA